MSAAAAMLTGQRCLLSAPKGLLHPARACGRRRAHQMPAQCRGGAPPQPMVVVQAPPPGPPPRSPGPTAHLMMGAVIFLQVRGQAGSQACATPAPSRGYPKPRRPRTLSPGPLPRKSQALALVGATVTGVLARKRREEMETLNAKLRHINSALRRHREEEVGGGDGRWPLWCQQLLLQCARLCTHCLLLPLLEALRAERSRSTLSLQALRAEQSRAEQKHAQPALAGAGKGGAARGRRGRRRRPGR